MRAQLCLPFVLASLAFTVDAAAQCGAQKLLASDAHGSAIFGFDVCLSNGRALIGSPESGFGGAYLFENGGSGWTETHKLVPAVPLSDIRFGYAVSLDGDRAAVGANVYPGTSSQWGAVYVFVLVGGVWTEEALLLSDQPGYGKVFGSSVSIQGDRLVVGEPGPYPHPGTIHIFDRVGGTWTRMQTVTTPGAHNYFGCSVSVDGDRIAAGSLGLDFNYTYEGAVQMLERDAQGVWLVTQTLFTSTPKASAFFGASVALQGDRLAVGAPNEDGRAVNSGAIHVFDRTGGTWLETARITTLDGEFGDRLGDHISLDGNRIAAGAQYDSVGAYHGGSAYVFEREVSEWKTLLKQSATEPATDHHYGFAAAVEGSTLLVGEYYDDEAGQYAGAAHIYDLDASVVTFCQTSPNSVGDGARISSAGSNSLAQNDFHLACDGAPTAKFGKFFYGPQPNNVPFGNGRLCIGGQFFRLEATTSSSTGNGFDWLDFNEPPASSGPGQIFAGSTWYFQYWYRDPSAGGANFNLSNGLQVTFCP